MISPFNKLIGKYLIEAVSLHQEITMLVYFFYLTAIVAAVCGQECDKNGILVYEDLGCTAEYGSDKKCPIKYFCQGLEPSDKTCYFRGKSYGNGEDVPSSLSYPSCNQGCSCRIKNGRSGFTCAILDCPEWLGVPVGVGCYRNYTLEACCSVGQICSPFDNIEKCVVDGKEHREGDRFYPPNTCLNCVCQKGFKGKFEEPFCKRRPCAHQLRRFGHSIQDSCAPFYSKELHGEVLCCPDDWICPDESEIIKGDGKSEETCRFGKKTLKIGQYFEKLNVEDGFGTKFKKVKCECVIPPFVKCSDE